MTCEWFEGKSGLPDLSKCKKCPHKPYCKGRMVLKEVGIVIKKLKQARKKGD